jgi:hypothetical protein
MVPDGDGYDFRPHASALASARELGFVSVLLDLPRGASLRSVVEDAARASACSIQWTSEGATLVVAGDRTVPLVVCASEYPMMLADCRRCADAPPAGTGFVTALRGLPGLGRELRRMTGAYPDPWSKDGQMRRVMRFLVELLDAQGTGVVVHPAGHVVWTKAEWLHQVGDPGDTFGRPFGALIDFGMTGSTIFTEGMDSFALPDVRLDMGPMRLPEDEQWDRASSAVLLACHTMAFDNRPLTANERFHVPLGIEVGRRHLADDDPLLSRELLDVYEVTGEGPHMRLTPRAHAPPVARVWSAAVSHGLDVPHAAYRALLKQAVRVVGGWKQTNRWTFGREDVGEGSFPHEVLAFAVPNAPASVMTCGVGRRRQHGGHVETDDAFVELLVRTQDPHPHIANLLSYLGRAFHERDPKAPPWGPEHRVHVGGPFAGAGLPWVGFAWGGRLELGEGPTLSLYRPIPMSESERAHVSLERFGDWLVEVSAQSEERWRAVARLAAR